jgi:hypothetical protein
MSWHGAYSSPSFTSTPKRGLPSCAVRVVLEATDEAQDIRRREIFLTPEDPVVTIGRSSSTESKKIKPNVNNAWLDSPVVSRTHAQLKLVTKDTSHNSQDYASSDSAPWQSARLAIVDMGSMHGTFINKSKMKLTPLHETYLGRSTSVTFGTEVQRNAQTFQPRRFNLKYEVVSPYPLTPASRGSEPYNTLDLSTPPPFGYGISTAELCVISDSEEDEFDDLYQPEESIAGSERSNTSPEAVDDNIYDLEMEEGELEALEKLMSSAQAQSSQNHVVAPMTISATKISGSRYSGIDIVPETYLVDGSESDECEDLNLSDENASDDDGSIGSEESDLSDHGHQSENAAGELRDTGDVVHDLPQIHVSRSQLLANAVTITPDMNFPGIEDVVPDSMLPKLKSPMSSNGKDTNQHGADLHTRSRISIDNILNSQSNSSSPSPSRKRKHADTFDMPQEESSVRKHRSTTSDLYPFAPIDFEDDDLPDAQPRDLSTPSEFSSLGRSTVGLTPLEPKSEPAAKRIKTSRGGFIRTAATALIGAAVGAVGVFAALAASAPSEI